MHDYSFCGLTGCCVYGSNNIVSGSRNSRTSAHFIRVSGGNSVLKGPEGHSIDALIVNTSVHGGLWEKKSALAPL
jgi:hypothetical protein